ncbi:hypothetical protein A3780_20545 [Kosakonia radicincitans]|uniref:hypothetical protein n=1 Tax=Kosakonia radicincitans TaxID=283686 RepID=UPI0009033707|nr:hypothetical protein [Kosakonia radicincitans]APG19832.1 hypothetical protein A3780_20545 [Kosakonia radicincitans]
MTFLHIVYFVAVFADRFVCFIAPKTLIAEWFFWFTSDAKSLLLVVRELELARSYQKDETSALLIEFSVYHAALFFGEREYYGLKVRWPRWFTYSLHLTGMQLDAKQWLEGCQNGFRDAVLESRATSHC